MEPQERAPQERNTTPDINNAHRTNNARPHPLATTVAEAVHQRENPLATFLFGSRATGDYAETHSDKVAERLLTGIVTGRVRHSPARGGHPAAANAYRVLGTEAQSLSTATPARPRGLRSGALLHRERRTEV